MSNFLPYNFDSDPSHPSAAAAAATAEQHAFSAHDATGNHFRPSSSPSHHYNNITVAEWAGVHLRTSQCTVPASSALLEQDIAPSDWRDVHRNIKRMDQLYDATFYSWLKSEDNVLVTAMYLHRIANEYGLGRIVNALKWLVADWRWESTSVLVRHVTADWCDAQGDFDRAHLLRHLTAHWATQYTSTLITTILATPPYSTSDNQQRERFLRALTKDWDFSRLSEFFMYLQSRANVDYKLKCVMLQEAARRERETLNAKLNNRKRQQQPVASINTVTTATEAQDPLSPSPPPATAAVAAAGTIVATDKARENSRNSLTSESERSQGKAQANQGTLPHHNDDGDYQVDDGHGMEGDNRAKNVSSSSYTEGQEVGSSSSTWRHPRRRISSQVAADIGVFLNLGLHT